MWLGGRSEGLALLGFLTGQFLCSTSPSFAQETVEAEPCLLLMILCAELKSTIFLSYDSDSSRLRPVTCMSASANTERQFGLTRHRVKSSYSSSVSQITKSFWPNIMPP